MTTAIAENVPGADARTLQPRESHLDYWIRTGAGVGTTRTPAKPSLGWEEDAANIVVALGSRTREDRYTAYGYHPMGWVGAPYQEASSAAGSLEEERHLHAARQAFATVRRAGGSIGAARAAADPHIRHAMAVRDHVQNIQAQAEQALDASIAAEAALMRVAPVEPDGSESRAWERALQQRVAAGARAAAWRRAVTTGALSDTLAALAA